ncbi:unnamed protein product [Adineta ricciae]|uniref:EGF-like domain-containing protein n=1 Tax=Adineta ricciae TaxID=249248 RepID=A0A815JJX7_ADIRI|nr:unnamed protein product [Adineta ricciae]
MFDILYKIHKLHKEHFEINRIWTKLDELNHQYANDVGDQAEFFRVVATLVNERNETIDREELILHYLISQYKHLFYLVYSDSNHRSGYVYHLIMVFDFNYSIANCSPTSVVCLNNGQCRQSLLSSSKLILACACPKRYYGDACQFTTLGYTISIDALKISRLLIILCSSVFIFATCANFLSVDLFFQDKLSRVDCGLYQ